MKQKQTYLRMHASTLAELLLIKRLLQKFAVQSRYCYWFLVRIEWIVDHRILSCIHSIFSSRSWRAWQLKWVSILLRRGLKSRWEPRIWKHLFWKQQQTGGLRHCQLRFSKQGTRSFLSTNLFHVLEQCFGKKHTAQESSDDWCEWRATTKIPLVMFKVQTTARSETGNSRRTVSLLSWQQHTHLQRRDWVNSIFN